MAFSLSGLYVANIIDVLDNTQLAIDTSLTSHKFSLYTNTKSPNFSSDVGYSATNEVTGTGWAAAPTIATVSGSPTTTESPAGSVMYDMNDISAATTTLAAVRGLILWADLLAGDNNIVAITFGADYSTTAGTFGVQWPSTGLFAIDITPP